MAVTDALDFTPRSTINTLQFRSELLNVIIGSLLTTLIASNIGSVIAKLLYLTPGDTFCYTSWLRSYIFTNSDDPLRIISWLRRRYVFRDPTWARAPQRLRWSRLVLPMQARCAVLLTTVGTIAVVIPTERRLLGCRNGDYRLEWDVSKADLADQVGGICQNVPLTSRLGLIRSIASYCTETKRNTSRALGEDSGVVQVIEVRPGTFVLVNRNLSEASCAFSVSSRGARWPLSFRVEWTNPERPHMLFLTDVASLDMDVYMSLANRAVLEEDEDCQIEETERGEDDISTWFDCNVGAFKVFLRLKTYTKNALTWKRYSAPQLRLIREGGRPSRFSFECPFDITAALPILNLVPLSIMFVISVAINLLVSCAVSKHGNVQDAAFHVIEDALGRDSTSNPLEENVEQDGILRMELKKWICPSTGGGHVSFIGNESHEVVEQFEESVVIGSCGSTAEGLVKVIKQSHE